MLKTISTFIEDELQEIMCQIGDTSVSTHPIKPITAAEKQAWLIEKAVLLEQDELLGHAVKQSLHYKEQVVDKKLSKLRA